MAPEEPTQNPAPATSAEAKPKLPAEEAKYLEWINQRLYEEIRSKWGQIEGVHTRTIATLTLLLGFAAFTVTDLRPLGTTEALVLAGALFLPIAAAIYVLWPRSGEHDVDNLIDERGADALDLRGPAGKAANRCGSCK